MVIQNDTYASATATDHRTISRTPCTQTKNTRTHKRTTKIDSLGKRNGSNSQWCGVGNHRGTCFCEHYDIRWEAARDSNSPRLTLVKRTTNIGADYKCVNIVGIYDATRGNASCTKNIVVGQKTFTGETTRGNNTYLRFFWGWTILHLSLLLSRQHSE